MFHRFQDMDFDIYFLCKLYQMDSQHWERIQVYILHMGYLDTQWCMNKIRLHFVVCKLHLPHMEMAHMDSIPPLLHWISVLK